MEPLLFYNTAMHLKRCSQKNRVVFQLIILILFYFVLRVPIADKALRIDEIRNTFMYLDTAPFAKLSVGKETPLHYSPLHYSCYSYTYGYSWGKSWKEQMVIHPPLLSAFYYFWIRCFGDSEISLHIPTIIAGFVAIMLLYFFGSFVFGNDIGFLAALAMVFSASHIVYSVEAVHAIFEMSIFLASLLTLYKLIITGNKKNFYLLLALNILGVFMFYHYFFYLIIQTIVLWSLKDRLKIGVAYFAVVFLLIALFSVSVIACYKNGKYYWDLWPKNNLGRAVTNIIFLPLDPVRW